MMRKIYLLSFAIILSLIFSGCNESSDNQEEANQSQEEAEQSQEENEQPPLILHTLYSEDVTRQVEGMEQKVEVFNYEIQPFGISFQLDEVFDSVNVEDTEISFSIEEPDYEIVLEIFEETTLDEAVDHLQDMFPEDEYEHVGELEDDSNEDGLSGKMQTFAYPQMTGFYAYEIDDYVLAIIYEYPEEAGDGMGPLLEDLKQSIDIDS